jgi:hypothetical protein
MSKLSTPEEIAEFCIANACKMASGIAIYAKTGSTMRGRIIGYSARSILLEDPNGKLNAAVPYPLPSVPYLLDRWHRLISPVNLGVAIDPSTIVLEEVSKPEVATTSAPVYTPVVKEILAQARRKCEHDCCDTWCKVKYYGCVP